jgi:hypothetical protein
MKTMPLDSTIQLGEPVSHRGVVVAPLFPRLTPVAAYVTLDEALPLGFRVTEVDAAGLVPELAVHNPLDRNVLLYDGEELIGAKQNRILNVTVLVAAGSKTTIPVSCVEEGRWQARSAAFGAAPHAAHPELRRRKGERLSAAPLARGIAQHEVWEVVRESAERHGSYSPTRAQADTYRSREADLAALRGAFPLQPGQCGALLAIGDALCLDYASRPDAFARLYPKLLDGYLLDALARLEREPGQGLGEFVAAVEAAPRSHGPSAGLGEDVRLASEVVLGSGLELDGELIQLCAFTRERRGPRTRIRRPSGRRH